MSGKDYFSKERLAELAAGWSMDCGGYEPENAPDYLSDVLPSGCVIVDGGLDYIAGDMFNDNGDPDFVVIDVGGYGSTFPEFLSDGPRSGWRNRKISEGELWETEHECDWCQGSGNAVDGDTKTDPRTCERCEGDGYTVSEGGSWAAYVREETPAEELPQIIRLTQHESTGPDARDYVFKERNTGTESDYLAARIVIACLIKAYKRAGFTVCKSDEYGWYSVWPESGNDYYRLSMEADVDN